LQQVLPPDALDRFVGPGDGHFERIVGKKGLGDQVQDIGRRIDFRQGELLQDYFALLGDHLFGHERVLDDVGDHFQGQAQVSGQDGDVELGVFPVRVGVEISSHGGDFPGDILAGILMGSMIGYFFGRCTLKFSKQKSGDS